MSLKTLCQMDLPGKRVLTRVDLNVPMIDGKIADTTRIEKIIPTISEIIRKGGTPILLAHMGRPNGRRHQNLSLSLLQEDLETYFNSKVIFAAECIGPSVETTLEIVKKGEIIIPSWTWVSTANAVINAGCKPVFADIELNSRNIDPEEIKKKISKRTVAVIIVHFGGMPCKMDDINKICKIKNITLIEDSAETIGGEFKKKRTGSFGIGCFSFFPTKNITTTEGGMLTTNNPKHFNYVKKLIAHGIQKNVKFPWKREAILPGHNFRMPNHLAALGVSQLRKLELFNKKRNEIAKSYNKFFNNFPNIIETQSVPKNIKHSYQMYTLSIDICLPF